MIDDPIIEEIRKFREEYAKRFDFDIDAMADDLRKLEEQFQDRLVSPSGKPIAMAREDRPTSYPLIPVSHPDIQ